MDYVTANGATIPAIGLGTWELRGRTCTRTVEQALRAGYRLIDTAEIYENEREVGDGIRASGVKRAEVFLTTKIWPDHLAPRELERATKASLARLRMSEVDLLLIHWPNPRVALAETIEALCKMKRAGFARHIGVSNFTVALLEEAVKVASEPLVVDQVEWHARLDQSKVVAACRRHGMAVVAYSPMARGAVLSDDLVKEIAAAHERSPAQVSLRFVLQEGGIVIPRTARLDRLTENLGIFDFALTDAEMAAMRGLARPNGRIVDPGIAPKWD
ncbi:oxidoreductase, aldo/keto reductase family [Rhodovulum sp. PH10]|uniref:aldo/keto reductase n=1 Tax=Rhodovulum sp. PH10 TaxID=1187851 RepID=UPI00027C2AAC|nr:aldo/keto reductase [Rhodovulum sp. PH10]EJW10079.1 oxidoreductase, aldo/keto reductase family [Rhodovulum sp. PH10]